ncbi:MAG TPA: glutaredoxin domain-containing protein [Polyangiaceae bacterium]|jgi:glutaredoxin 3|nr:glutaredoxin domain-containing protein [Polyangiaceae bacterium]
MGSELPRVRVFRTRHCPYCLLAAKLLSFAGIEFEEIDVSGDREQRRWLARVSGQGTVPQIFVGETAIGGYSELRALLRGGPAALYERAASEDEPAAASEEGRAGAQPEQE